MTEEEKIDVQSKNDVEKIDNAYLEETAAEAVPFDRVAGERHVDDNDNVKSNGWLGGLALALSLISLFLMPILLGAAGIITGFMARRRGAEGTGSWAIGIGIVSIAVSLFIAPFF